MSQQDPDDWDTFENEGFTRSEIQDGLLASEHPLTPRINGDFNPTTTLPKIRSDIGGIGLEDYAPKTLWNPVWLHKAVLLGFCTLFAAIFVTLILLYYLSGQHHGLSIEISRNPYSWTYGPTAGECPSI